MIKLKLKTMENEVSKEVQIISGESVRSAVSRTLEFIPMEFKPEEVFVVVVNGHIIESDVWEATFTRVEDNILIAPRLMGDDGGQLFKQALIITVTVVASIFLSPAAGATFGAQLAAALEIAAITMAASLALNALIPPPVTGTTALSGSVDSSASQMYSITSQANSLRKFDTVPKVYGRHRIFPVVAANPYTEIDTDPTTGELVQYLYSVYDFGLGPVMVENLQIGDSPLSDFSDVSISLVDFHKPPVREGPWDDVTVNYLRYYKGDVNVDPVAVVLEGNRDGGVGDPIATYEVVRNAAVNPSGAPLTISLNIVLPKGLYAYSSTGVLGYRSVNLEIYFSKVGEDNWIPYNDLNAVSSFSGVGGDAVYQQTDVPPFPARSEPNNIYVLSAGVYYDIYFRDENAPADDTTIYPSGGGIYNELSSGGVYRAYFQPHTQYEIFNQGYNRYVYAKQFGYIVGSTQLILKQDPNVPFAFGGVVYFKGAYVGTVASATPYSGQYYRVNLTAGIPFSIVIYTYITIDYGLNFGISQPADYIPSDNVTTGKFTYSRAILGKGKITANNTSAVYATYKFTPKVAAQYKVRLTRTSTTSDYNSQVADSLTLGAITTRFDRAPIRTEKRHTFLEVRIRATNQLNGAISNISAVCTSVLDTWNGSAWVKAPTNNPAWVVADLLTGDVNKKALPKSRLHIQSLVEWANFCAQVPTPPPGMFYVMPRFQTNFILDFGATLQSLINQVAGSAQASLNLIDGKYGVLLDIQRDTPVQIFTNRNSKGFSSSRSYSAQPNVINVKYIDPTQGWQVAEKAVYDDGFNADNAIDQDDLTSFAVTNDEQAWRFGRYMLAQNRLRKEIITLTVDFEYLVCTRGDYVQLVQDVMKVGGTAARVNDIVGSTITIDDGIETDPDLDYGYIFRSSSGLIEQGTLKVISSDTFELSGPYLPAEGDLIVIGEVDFIVYDCIVKSITPNDGLTADLVLVEKADAIYQAESTNTFPPYDAQISRTSASSEFSPPGDVGNLQVTDNLYECFSGDYRYFIDLMWDAPTGSAYEVFEIYVDTGRGYNLAGNTRSTVYKYVVDAANIGKQHNFKVLAVSSTGKKIDLGSATAVSATPLSKTTPPSDVASLSTNIVAETLQLSWTRIADCDAKEYLIRYSPLPNGGSWESSIPLTRVDRNTSLTSVNGRTGTYFIKAVDFNDNESTTAAIAITTIPNLFGLNIVNEVTDFPDLLGSFDKTEKDGDTLVLQHSVVGGVETAEFYSEGYYYYKDLLDLGEIFTVRLQSLIQAEGYTAEDVMSNWTSLDTVLLLSNSRFSEWDVEAQYRATNEFNSIEQWNPLSDVEVMSVGDTDNFTPWRSFTIGDAVGRIFEFRLKLISNKTSVTPRVFDGTIRADMPDRLESYSNITAPIGGVNIPYNPPFAGPGTSPNVQVSIDGAQPGDTVQYLYRGLDSVTIEVVDVNGNPVERTIDVQAKGFGRQYNTVI